MPPVRISWEKRAVREMMGLSKEARGRVLAAVEALAENPLKGELLAAEWQGLRRLRVGTYRVIYAFDGSRLLVAVVRVGHRREVYR